MVANEVSFLKTAVSTCGEDFLWFVGTETAVHQWRFLVERDELFDLPTQSAILKDSADRFEVARLLSWLCFVGCGW